MKNSKKFSISDLKEKAGKAFLDVNAIKGGTEEDCHVELEQLGPIIHKTDNV